MTPQEKQQSVEELKARLERATAIILTEYRGLKAQELNLLRQTVRKAGLEYKVVKNTLFTRAARGTYAEAAARDLKGPVAVLFGYDDPVGVAKAASARAGELEKLIIKSGLIDKTYYLAADIEALARLPGRHELLSRLAATVQAPVAQTVFTLQSLVQRLVGTLDAYAQSKSG